MTSNGPDIETIVFVSFMEPVEYLVNCYAHPLHNKAKRQLKESAFEGKHTPLRQTLQT